MTAISEALKCCCLTKISVSKTGFVLNSAAQRCALVAVLLLLPWGIPIAAQQVPPSELGNEAKVPDSNTIVQAMEAAQRNNPANSRAYNVTRQYKLFHNNDKQPVSETRAEISFVPPDTKRYVIKQVSGNSANAWRDAEETAGAMLGALRGYCPITQSPGQHAEPKRRTACGQASPWRMHGERLACPSVPSTGAVHGGRNCHRIEGLKF